MGPRAARTGTAALCCLVLGGVASIVSAVLTLRLGWLWLGPMAGSLLLAVGPAGGILIARRVRLHQLLGEIPVRRYRSPRRANEDLAVLEVRCDLGRVTGFRVVPARSLSALSDRMGLLGGAVLHPCFLRVRYRDVPFFSCIPAVLAGCGGVWRAVTWLGSERLLQVDMEPAREIVPAECAAASAAVREAGIRAELRRGDDLALIGGLVACPVEAVAGLLLEAGYERHPSLSVVAVSDFLTLCELEFALPSDSEFRAERVDFQDPANSRGFEGLHAEGSRSDTGESLDLVLIRESEAWLAVFLRRGE
jgi:hypothetical protein